MEYLVQLFLFKGDGPPVEQGVLIASHLPSSIDEWLAEKGLPKLYMWKFAAQSGSNAPNRRGVLNTVHYDLPGRLEKLVFDTHALKPVDPFKERLL